MDKPKRKIADIVPPSSISPLEKPKEEVKTELEPEIKPKPFDTLFEDEEEIEEVKPERKEERIFPGDLFSKTKDKKKTFIILAIICLVVLGSVLYFTLSKAEVIITPKTETMRFQAELNIDKNIAFVETGNSKIPGQLFRVGAEKQREFPATQEKELQEKARGIITVYNQYSSAPQTLVETTRFVAEEGGKLFRATKTIVIPGAKIEEGKIIPSSVDVEVVAAEPGDEYNIGPSSFTIPGFKGTAKYTGFYGESTKSMGGGIVGKVKVVSAEDIQGAEDVLIAELKQEAEKELKKRIPSGLKVLEDTILVDVVESSSSVEADHPADKFTLKVEVAAKVLGFNENDAISLINDNLESKISENKSLIPDTISISYQITDINMEKGIAKLTCEVSEDVAWKINTEEVRQMLAGKNEIEVRQYLASQAEIESAKVIFWPFWVKKIPSNEKKIEITVD